jgi:putative peptidoglycan lipid II flippase
MISIVSNILFSILLVPLMKHTGVALATTASAWCNCIYLMISLKKLGSVKITKETKVEVFKQCIASLIMGVALYFIEPYFETIIASKWAVWSSIIVSIFVFFIIGKIFGIFKFFSEIKETA